jgi:uncharacterized protein
MTRRLTAASTLDNLKKEARRWLRALRSGDRRARVRLDRAYPQASAAPGLRDVQQAIALEHGLTGWAALKKQLPDHAVAGGQRAELIKPEELGSDQP